ncbi:MAG: T9SS type A sorting domain-containing protein [Bacteroidota bacterium]
MRLYLLLLLCVIGGSSIVFGQTIVRDTIRHSALDRSYILYIPSNYQATENWPLVMLLHGGGQGNGESLLEQLQFHEVADTANFLCLYPNGFDNQWADGRGVTTPDVAGVDDVQFLNDLLDSIALDYPFDAANVFVTGGSNGGMMTQRLACETPNTFRAYATMIASMPDPVHASCAPGTTVNMLLMNGTEDILVPYDGGSLHPLTDGGSVLGTDATIAFWKDNNSCTTNSQVLDFENTDLTDGSTVHLTQYRNCTDSSKVVLYRVEGAGHTIPGMVANMNPRPIVGYTNYDIVAALEIWRFFKSHLIPPIINNIPVEDVEHSVQLYPNPTNGTVFIRGLEGELQFQIDVLDVNGKVLLESNDGQALELATLPDGLYYVRVVLPERAYTLPLIMSAQD